MKNKILLWAAPITAAVMGFAINAAVNADAFFTVPTSTASTLTANVGDQIGDPGTLLVLGLAIGIPLTFYVLHQIIGLAPKSRARRA